MRSFILWSRRLKLVLPLLFLSSAAEAADVQFDGMYRARLRVFDTLSLDRDAQNSEGYSSVAKHRVWLRPSFILSDQVSAFVDLRALHNVSWGQQATETALGSNGGAIVSDNLTPPTDGSPETNLATWRAWAEFQTGSSQFRFGRMPVHWASGIWWNDGTSAQQLMSDHGDVVDRVSWKYLVDNQFYVGAGVDLKSEGLSNVQDDTLGYHGTLFYRNETVNAGMVAEYRHTAAPDENERFNLFTMDLALDAELGKLSAHLETVGQFGGGALPDIGDGVSLTAFGALLDVGLQAEPWTLQMATGLATGDEDPNDLRLRTFSFDPDYSVGLFMFEQTMPVMVDAVPTEANDGRTYDEALTGGAISNAFFVKPTVSRDLGRSWTARGYLLAAWAAKLPSSEQIRKRYGMEAGLGINYAGIEHVELDTQFGIFQPGTYYSESTATSTATFEDIALGGQVVGLVRF